MVRKETKALLAEYRRAVNTLSSTVSGWNVKANRTIQADLYDARISTVRKGVRASYEYIIWIEKTAALPRFSPPDCIGKLESADLQTLLTAINLLAPFASECLGNLTDEKLQYRPVRDYTLEQMLEHAIVSVWLLLGQVEN